MSSILSVSAAAVIAALCGVMIKKSNGETALLLSLCGVVLIGYAAFSNAAPLIEWMDRSVEKSEVGEIFPVMLKVLGTTMVANTVSGLCTDCGENALAAGVRFMAKIITLLLCIPLLERFLALIEEILVL